MSDNSLRKFKPVLLDHIEAYQLDHQQLSELMKMQAQAYKSNQLMSPNSIYKNILMGLAACFLIFVTTLVINMYSNNDYKQQIAKEVVKNHLKLKPLDVEADNIHSIQKYFNMLDFKPNNSIVFGTDEQLLGGRYCSIKGITAAQLRYENTNNIITTLYQVGYEAETFGNIPNLDKGDLPYQMNLKGFEVSMWVEKDLLMVLVGE